MDRCSRCPVAIAGRSGGLPDLRSAGAQIDERNAVIWAVIASGFERWGADIGAGPAAMAESGEFRPDT